MYRRPEIVNTGLPLLRGCKAGEKHSEDAGSPRTGAEPRRRGVNGVVTGCGEVRHERDTGEGQHAGVVGRGLSEEGWGVIRFLDCLLVMVNLDSLQNQKTQRNSNCHS